MTEEACLWCMVLLPILACVEYADASYTFCVIVISDDHLV